MRLFKVSPGQDDATSASLGQSSHANMIFEMTIEVLRLFIEVLRQSLRLIIVGKEKQMPSQLF